MKKKKQKIIAKEYDERMKEIAIASASYRDQMEAYKLALNNDMPFVVAKDLYAKEAIRQLSKVDKISKSACEQLCEIYNSELTELYDLLWQNGALAE